jgi:hypothetical protein
MKKKKKDELEEFLVKMRWVLTIEHLSVLEGRTTSYGKVQDRVS